MLVYEFAMECGTSDESVEALLASLRGLAPRSTTALVYEWNERRYRGYDGNSWVSLRPRGPAEVRPQNIDDRDISGVTDQIAAVVCQHEFRFAMAGVEVELLRDFAELQAEQANFFESPVTAWLLTPDIWQVVGCPSGFTDLGRYKYRPYGVPAPRR
jgi:hypothetical protein